MWTSCDGEGRKDKGGGEGSRSKNSCVGKVVMYVCMYVCMHACMYVWMYACMHACMYAWAASTLFFFHERRRRRVRDEDGKVPGHMKDRRKQAETQRIFLQKHRT